MLFNLTLPEVLGKSEVKILKVVDLPAPFGPNKPNISPESTPNEFSLIATVPFG